MRVGFEVVELALDDGRGLLTLNGQRLAGVARYRLPDDPTSEDRFARAVVGLAGLEAERRRGAAVSRFGLEHDWARYWGIIVRDGIDAHDRDASHAFGLSTADEAWWRSFVETTVELMEGWWPAVERVALELHRAGRLEGHVVHELVGQEAPGEGLQLRTRIRRARVVGGLLPVR